MIYIEKTDSYVTPKTRKNALSLDMRKKDAHINFDTTLKDLNKHDLTKRN